jgi:F0F1-type ATP synthase epsilon subunit
MIEETTKEAEEIAAAQAARRAGAKGRPTMHIKVYSPFKVYYDEDSYSISAVNATGPFDILPRHHNFMSLLGACVLVVRPVNGPAPEQHIKISGGLMHVKSDKVTVFLDI